MCVVDINSRVCCLAAQGDPEGTSALPCYHVILKTSIIAAPTPSSWNVKSVRFRGTRCWCVLSMYASALDWCHLPGDDDASWRRLDHVVLLKSFISVTHCPSQRNWWIVQIYGIPMPEQVGIFFRGFARLMRVSHCSSRSSLVRDRDDVTHRSRANFKCEVSHVNKQLPVDLMSFCGM